MFSLDRFQLAVERFDAANAEDPNRELVDGLEEPRELVIRPSHDRLYGSLPARGARAGSSWQHDVSTFVAGRAFAPTIPPGETVTAGGAPTWPSSTPLPRPTFFGALATMTP